MTTITFTHYEEDLTQLNPPSPAHLHIPDWYKKTDSYANNKKIPINNGQVGSTVKRCMPVFDAITAGYLIFTSVDIYVSQKDNAPYFEWPMGKPIDFHPVLQAENHPAKNGYPYPKFLNAWGIKTKPGYSVLITQPVHRDLPFQILEGVVDTDKYVAPVNFPFVLKDVKWEGLIPAGTPIAQIIPFKRENYTMKIGNIKEQKEIKETLKNLRSLFFDAYKTMYRTKKHYN